MDKFMATSVLREAIRAPLPALSKGYRFWRVNGARIRRATTLCEHADALRFHRRRGWSSRSERLYARVMNELGKLTEVEGPGLVSQDALPERALLAHRSLFLARRPYRVLGWGLALWLSALSALMTLAVLLVTAVSPGLRQRVFPHDLAQGRPWSASSSYSGMPTEGVGPASDKPAFFHTNDTDQPWLQIDLGGDHVVRSLLIVNRSDCCEERAIPLNVEALVRGNWKLIAQRRAPFTAWKYDVDPIHTSRVRVRLPGHGFLHLKRISVYGE
jgi:hypothetical protein